MTTNYREILRLESLGLNKTDIASAAQCARNTVSTTLARAKACGLQWPLPEGMSDKELEERLFPSAPGKVVYKMPDYAHVHREMQRQGVTLFSVSSTLPRTSSRISPLITSSFSVTIFSDMVCVSFRMFVSQLHSTR